MNVTREIDNFFPGTFDYLNIRVYDDEKTDLLKHWDNTFKYISKARQEGSKVLVHCKMGVSRSASVVIAYAMKAYNWDFKKALQHVKEKRSCIKPNTSFLSQLETYQGILDAMKNKEKLQRSKSETNLKSPGIVAKNERVLAGSEPTPVIQALARSNALQTTLSGQDLRQLGARPKSWSPDNTITESVMPESKTSPVFLSLENLNDKKSVSKESLKSAMKKSITEMNAGENVLMPCDNGESYSVSPNRIVHLPGHNHDQTSASVKDRVNELEAQQKTDKKKLVLNLTTQFESTNDASSSNEEEAQPKLTPPMLRAVLVKKEIWDPGEKQQQRQTSTSSDTTINDCDLKSSVLSEEKTVAWTAITETKNSAVSSNTNNNQVPEPSYNTIRSKTLSPRVRDGSDPFSNQLDRVFDKEERKQQRHSAVEILPAEETALRECPSRQSSWSSYDSAVVLGEARDSPSRHSSWGSGDTRTLPSRNSSWGSYDMRPGAPIHYLNEKGEKIVHSDAIETSSSGLFQYDKDDVPWNTGTVKRTKQKLEESGGKKPEATDTVISLHSECPVSVLSHSEGTAEAFNTALIDCNNLEVVGEEDAHLSAGNMPRLSVSAPESSAMELVSQECSLSRSASNVSTVIKLPRESSSSVISTTQCSSVRQHKNYLENLGKDLNNTCRKLDELDETSVAGIVQNLKKEFEAKTETLNGGDTVKTKNRVNSLPSSPITIHVSREEKEEIVSPTSSDPGEDLNFKKLVGKFETNEKMPQVILRSRPCSQNKTARHSCIEVSSTKAPSRRSTTLISSFNRNNSLTEGEFKRPPIPPLNRNTAPNVVVATVIAKAAKKQQQFGKSHPLARLNIRPRHNSPVYNTM